MVCHRVRRDSKKPDCERNAAPFELIEISQGMLKHFRGHVLSIMAVEHTPGDECVNALEVSLVQFGEPSRVFLRGLDQQAFLIHYLYKPGIEAKSHGRKKKSSWAIWFH